jgi:hypothetical protein
MKGFFMWSAPRLFARRLHGNTPHKGAVLSVPCGPCRDYIKETVWRQSRNPCGDGVQYLHRDPASRRRRRKEKSQIWDSKMWSRVPRDSVPRKTALAKASSIYKRQTRPLVRKGAPQKQDRNCQTVINMWSWALDGARHQDLLTDWLTDWLTVAVWLWLWLWQSRGKRMGIQWRTTEYNREYENGNWVQLSVGDSLGKLVVEGELEVSLWTLFFWWGGT